MLADDPFSFDDPSATSSPPTTRRSTSKRTSSISNVKQKASSASMELSDSAGGGRMSTASSRGTGGTFGGGGDGKLHFPQRLVPHVSAKPLGTPELLKRLKDLQDQLSKLQQDSVDLSTLQLARKDLVNPSLMMHKDKGVKAWVACCLADILRLFAPDAPYNMEELRDIFEFFAKQMTYISDPSGPYFAQYFYLLESLATVKSAILITDLNADDLTLKIFHDIYQLVKPEMQKNVYGFLLDILQQLVEESGTLSQDIIEIILSQFSKKKKSENPARNKLSIDLCTTMADKLQRYVCQYFSEVFVAATKKNDDEDESYADFEAAHELILEISAVAKGVLMNVVPLLEEELQYDDVRVRTLATQVVGKMVSEPGSTVASAYPSTFKVWLDRRNDKQQQVRILWLDFCLDIFRHHSELCAEISAGVEQKLMDPDEKVRLAAVKLFTLLDAPSLLNVPKDLLIQASHRCKDKKPSIRSEASRALSRIFKMTYADIVNPDDQHSDSKYGWIPGSLLELMYLDDADSKVMVERALQEDIFPVNLDDAARVERCLRVLGCLNERQRNAFYNVLVRQASTIKTFLSYLECCETWNGGIMDNDDGSTEKILHQVVQFIAEKLPDSKKAQVHLMKFAKNNEGRIYKLLRAIMDESADYKSIIKYNKEVMKRLEPHAGLIDTFSIILRRISLTLVGKSSIPLLIEAVRDAKRPSDGYSSAAQKVAMGNAAEMLIKTVATTFPGVYKNHVIDFVGLLESDDSSLVADALEALSKFAKTFAEDLVLDSSALKVLSKLILFGNMQEASKAAIIIAKLSDQTECANVLSKIIPRLRASAIDDAIVNYKLGLVDDDQSDKLEISLNNSNITSWLAALVQIALHSPGLFEDYHTNLVNFIVREILMKNRMDDPHDGEDFVEFDKLAIEGTIKVLGLKVLVNRLRAQKDTPEAQELAKPVYNVLNKILETDGEITKTEDTCPAFKSHLRLTATICLLKLSRTAAFEDFLSVNTRDRMCLMVQDPSWQVRDRVVERVRKYLNLRELPFRYVVMLFMAAHEPDSEILGKSKTFLQRLLKIQKVEEAKSGLHNVATLESMFANLIHTVAHHPDFGLDDDDIMFSAKYLEFFLDIVATNENISFLFHAAAQLKTMKDLHSESSEALYLMSDLAQFLVQEHCAHYGWSLPSYPTSIPYDRVLFKRLTSAQGNENLKKNYLPRSWIESRQNTTHKVKMEHPPAASASSTRRKSAQHSVVVSSAPNSDVEDAVDMENEESDSEKAKKKVGKGKAKGKAVVSPENSRKKRKVVLAEDVPQRQSAPRTAKSAARKSYTLEDDDDENDGDENSSDEEMEDAEDDEEYGRRKSSGSKRKGRGSTTGGSLKSSPKGAKSRKDDEMDVDENEDDEEEEVPLRNKKLERQKAAALLSSMKAPAKPTRIVSLDKAPEVPDSGSQSTAAESESIASTSSSLRPRRSTRK
ncbi:hypothetical protein HDV05_002913 [Chytridiales sp. JEL 0842]|nr:hypothetical protein HDV05_002913 [Chytridiales sp. JEL 0842]